MRIAAGVEYRGAGFKGWQTQNGERTVQACLEQAISTVADRATRITTAGRTDTGVHASGQVVHFDSDATRTPYSWLRGTNTYLPADVRLQWVRECDPEFHARFCALSRSYRYVILNRPVASALHADTATWVYRPLDLSRMAAAAPVLVGEHDFGSFRAAGCQAKTAIRTVRSLTVNRSGEWLWIDITANAFLQHMVRNIAGALIAIGHGDRSGAWLAEVLAARDRTTAAVTAPAQGLYLCAVEYPARFLLPAPPPPPPVRFW